MILKPVQCNLKVHTLLGTLSAGAWKSSDRAMASRDFVSAHIAHITCIHYIQCIVIVVDVMYTALMLDGHELYTVQNSNSI